MPLSPNQKALRQIHAKPGLQVLQGNTGNGGVPQPKQVPVIPPNTSPKNVGNGGMMNGASNVAPSFKNEPKNKGANPKKS